MLVVAALAGLVVGSGLLAFAAGALEARAAGLAVLAAVSTAAGAVLASGSPTGWTPLDAALRALLAVGVTVAAYRSGSAWVIWLTAVATLAIVVASGPLESLAPVALGLAIAPTAVGKPSPVLNACAAALAVQVLLRLEGPLVTGVSLLTTLLAVAPVLVVAYWQAPHRARRYVHRAAAGALGFAALGSGLAVAAVLAARDDIDAGVTAAVNSQAAIGGGDFQSAPATLQTAREAFDRADRALGAWWARPAYAVPFVAQQARAVKTMAQTGSALTNQAIDALSVVTADALSPRDGRIDLEAVATAAEPLSDIATTLERSHRLLADASSPWLVPPVADRYRQLTAKVDHSLATATVAAQAARLAPAMLGADGPRRYLLVVQTPSESRGSGGFMGNWGEITAVDGRLELARFGRITELNDGRGDLAGITITGHDEFVAQYGDEVVKTWGVNNFSPDFATVADVLAQLYPQSGGASVDGVISIDPYGLAAMLQAVGDVAVEGWPEPLTSQNAAQVLLHEQYIRFAPTPDDVTDEDRRDFLGDTARAVFDQLVGGGFGGFSALTDAMAPAVDGRHLQMISTHGPEQALFESLGATGAPRRLVADSVGVVGQNYDGNKIDYFLSRRSSYDVHWDPATGALDGTLVVELRNDAPTSGLPDTVILGAGIADANQTPTAPGENLMRLSVYSAFPLQSLSLDGAPLAAAHAQEAGRHVYTAFVSLPSKATRVVSATTKGSLAAGQPYRLDPIWQPMVNADTLAVRVDVPSGWVLDDLVDLTQPQAGVASADWTLDRSHAGRATARRSENAILEWLRGER